MAHFRSRQDQRRKHTLGQADLHFEVTTFYDGAATEVRVTLMGEHDEEFYGEGVARCRPGDAYDSAIGQHIAFLRAAQYAIEEALIEAQKSVESERAVANRAWKALVERMKRLEEQQKAEEEAECLACKEDHREDKRRDSGGGSSADCCRRSKTSICSNLDNCCFRSPVCQHGERARAVAIA